jgi:hypothetical protein
MVMNLLNPHKHTLWPYRLPPASLDLLTAFIPHAFYSYQVRPEAYQLAVPALPPTTRATRGENRERKEEKTEYKKTAYKKTRNSPPRPNGHEGEGSTHPSPELRTAFCRAIQRYSLAKDNGTPLDPELRCLCGIPTLEERGVRAGMPLRQTVGHPPCYARHHRRGSPSEHRKESPLCKRTPPISANAI